MVFPGHEPEGAAHFVCADSLDVLCDIPRTFVETEEFNDVVINLFHRDLKEADEFLEDTHRVTACALHELERVMIATAKSGLNLSLEREPRKRCMDQTKRFGEQA